MKNIITLTAFAILLLAFSISPAPRPVKAFPPTAVSAETEAARKEIRRLLAELSVKQRPWFKQAPNTDPLSTTEYICMLNSDGTGLFVAIPNGDAAASIICPELAKGSAVIVFKSNGYAGAGLQSYKGVINGVKPLTLKETEKPPAKAAPGKTGAADLKDFFRRANAGLKP